VFSALCYFSEHIIYANVTLVRILHDEIDSGNNIIIDNQSLHTILKVVVA